MRKFSLIVLLVQLFLVMSCDILDEDPKQELTAATQFSDADGLRTAVNASYTTLRNFFGDEQGANMTEYGTDLITNAGQGGFRFMNRYDGGLNSDATPINVIWDQFYLGIAAANTAISRSEGINMDETMKAKMVAEARYMRAFYHFYLVQFYGPIPLKTEETKGVDVEEERTPVPQVYDQIVADLEFAIDNLLPPSEEPPGRATKATAEMLLSQVLLTRGYLDFAQPDDFERAATLAENVVNNYNFRMLEDFEQIFVNGNTNNEEIVWAVQYGTDPLLNGPGNRSHLYYRPWYEIQIDGVIRTNEPGYGRPWIRFKTTRFALENFRPLDQDSRFEKSFQSVWLFNDAATLPDPEESDKIADDANLAVGDTAIYIDPNLTAEEVAELQPNTPFDLLSWDALRENFYPNLTKHDDWERPSTNEPAGTKDYPVFRLSEAHLFAAEAFFQMGQMDQAVEHLNAVRRRAAWPGQEQNMISNTADLLAERGIDFILEERGRELYGEQKRWLTLKRTGKLLERVREYNDIAAQNIQEFHRLRPIPADQINRTDNEFPQNPGF